ncbi:MAG: hypothetical protein KatS3mg061_0343 [Dehalococcoidia bacterium]|nr:MAG: hypothetical protein KatS3mg061_0343 [Dehalococcoidia bacterium]
MPISWAILESDEGIWLIDCGLATAAAGDPSRVYGPVGQRARLLFTETLEERLAAAGLDRSLVAGVLLTHLHYDHAGALVDLPAGVPAWVHAAELAAAQAAGARLGYHPSILTAAVAWRSFVGDQQPLAGVALIETPGHSRGHVSVLITLGEQRYLVTGDAAPTVRNLSDRLLPGLHVDRTAAAASLDRLIALWRSGASPLPSHDPAFWAAQPEAVVRLPPAT